jgi:predicted nucleic-acid-binding protein
VFVRSDEEAWRDCTALLRAITENTIEAYIPLLVAIEVQFVLDSFYGFKKHQVVEAMKSLIAVTNLQQINDISIERAIELFEAKNVKFTDCLLASSKRIGEGKAAIISYDRDFDALGIKRLEPKDVLRRLKV